MYFRRIKDIREDTDHTQQELAEALNTHRVYYNRLENGKHQITLETAVKIADFYNISLDWLTGRTDRKEINK